MRWMMLSLAAGALVLSGCAAAPIVAEQDVDFAKVARIERLARAVGVDVYWVNYPKKSTTSVN